MSTEPAFHLNDQSTAIKELQTRPHWVGYRKEERKGSITKVPYSPLNGRHAQSNEPASWSDYQTAEAAVQKYRFDGLGYMFHQDFTGVDLDHCVDDSGQIESWALTIINFLDSYTEFSPSATGVHILVRGHIPHGIRRFIPPNLQPRHQRAAIEMYCEKRYFTVTGNHVTGTPDELESRQEQLDMLFQQITHDQTSIAHKKTPPPDHLEYTSTPAATPPATSNQLIPFPAATSHPSTRPQDLSDEALLQRACDASNGEHFRHLYYQGSSNRYTSPSEADMALCLHLAFWTGRDAERMDQLFRHSALYREKWDSTRSDTTYGWETIQRAIQHCSETYTPHQSKAEVIQRIETLMTLADGEDEMIQGEYTLRLQDISEEKRWSYRPHKVSLHEVLACLQDNEAGDAQLFSEVSHKLVCFDVTENSWYIWREHTWQHDTMGDSALLLVTIVADIYGKAADMLSSKQDVLLLQQIEQMKSERRSIGQEHVSNLKDATQGIAEQIEQLRKRANLLRSYKRMRNVLTLAAPLMRVHTAVWDQKPFLLPTPNGVIDLTTGVCNEGCPDDYLRISCPTNWTGLDTPCPRWERFLQEIFADKPERDDIINFLQRLLGYGITGSTQDHIFSMFYGADGRNGKDTLLGVFHDVMGNLANVVPNDIFLAGDYQRSGGSATPHLSLLHGMRSAWGSEPNFGDRIDIGQIKQLTGGGDISTRSLYAKSFYSFTPTHKLFMMTNHKLAINASEEAAWERLCLIDFGMRFLDNPDPSKANERPRDRSLIDTLKQERSGILAWLVRGCLDWHKHGLNIPPIIRKFTHDYQAEEDTLKSFIEDTCYRDPDAHINASALYSAYRQWHREKQYGPSMTSTMFGREMSKRFKKEHSHTGTHYYGIGLGHSCNQPPLSDEEFEKPDESDGLMGLQTSSAKKNQDSNNKSLLETPSNSSDPSGPPAESAKQPKQLEILSSIEDQLPAFLIPPHYNTTDPDIQPQQTSTRANILDLKKRIQCENCREQWDDVVKHNDLAQAHQGVWWCDHCDNRYQLMQLAHAKGYPELKLRHFDIHAGSASWLIFARTEHEKRVEYILNILKHDSTNFNPGNQKTSS